MQKIKKKESLVEKIINRELKYSQRQFSVINRHHSLDMGERTDTVVARAKPQ